MTAVSNKNWKSDWNTLEGLHLKKITHIQHWEIMTKIVDQMRADFLLAPFQPTKGMYLTVNDIHLKPITGIKVGLVGSRHFAVS
ncbi:hypothetical protein [uncultured Pseudodesulfovibrio sp.]|uniref:hypothetical protein n=1 Tax=uncultured Pseudodesulfovibrio sp. TaxID=2035858 RepID=UPI0029C7100A|nr:hypothetical protein [uncultured Pseudodesulfovibrio sp.]